MAPGGGVRERDEEDAVEAPGRRKAGSRCQGRSSREDQDALVGVLHAVELGQELVDLGATPAAAQVRAAGPQGVHLVEEEHAGGPPGPVEEGVQVLLAVADPHVQHVVDAHGDEAGLDLPGGGAGEVRLAQPGGPYSRIRPRRPCRRRGRGRGG